MDRVAVVTGANKGIGLEICRQLASNGVFVVLTARDVTRGNEAIARLASVGISNVVFHPLDVMDRTSVSSLADLVKARFGKLDILVNNAGITGATFTKEDLVLTEDMFRGPRDKLMKEFFKETYESAEECLRTNYYGTKQVTAALLPLLQQSNLPKVVNVSSSVGQLKYIPGKNIKEELNDVDSLTEEKLDGLVARFLKDMKENAVETGGWPIILSAYVVSKATLNAYTRVLAKIYPGIAINAVHPGYVKTDLSHNIGSPVEEGARGPVAVALMPKGGPSGSSGGFHGRAFCPHGTQFRGPRDKLMKEFFKETYESAEECLRTNYYGTKQVTAALLPLLQQSNLPKVVNVSSSVGQLKYIPGKNIKEELNDVDSLTEEKLDGLVARFLKDMKENAVETGGWPIILSAYVVSKATLNAYTRVLAKIYPGIAINAVHPGYVKTDLSHNIGSPVEEGARGPVAVALMPKGGPSGAFFNRTEVWTF